MNTLLPQMVFALVLMTFGMSALFFTDELRSCMLRIVGENKARFIRINPSRTMWSIRFGAFIAIVMGLFMLWALWWNY